MMQCHTLIKLKRERKEEGKKKKERPHTDGDLSEITHKPPGIELNSWPSGIFNGFLWDARRVGRKPAAPRMFDLDVCRPAFKGIVEGLLVTHALLSK